MKAAGPVRSTRWRALHRILPLVVGLGGMLLFDSTAERLMGFAGGALAGAVGGLALRWLAQRTGRVR